MSMARTVSVRAGRLETKAARRRTQEERSAATRAALIRAAVELITDCGYAATTTALVAGRAGVSRGALQHHFKSREEMIVAVMDYLEGELSFRVDPAPLLNRPLAAPVDAWLEHYRAMCRSPVYR